VLKKPQSFQFVDKRLFIKEVRINGCGFVINGNAVIKLNY